MKPTTLAQLLLALSATITAAPIIESASDGSDIVIGSRDPKITKYIDYIDMYGVNGPPVPPIKAKRKAAELEAREPGKWQYVNYADYPDGGPPPGSKKRAAEAESRAGARGKTSNLYQL